MSDDSDLIKLYSKRILALAADIPHTGHLQQPQGTAKKRAPLCGSTVTAEVVMRNGRIAEFGQIVRACALGQASSAVLGGAVLGCDRATIARGRDQLAAMLTEDGPTPEPPFDGLEVLRPARDFANRHASILLAWEATLAAINAAEGA